MRARRGCRSSAWRSSRSPERSTRWRPRKLVANALDLRHRLPLVRALVEDLQVEVWLARRIATATRELPEDLIGLVDRAMADCLPGEAPSRVLEILAAKVIEADPDRHAEKVAAERKRRYVGLGRTDEFGLRLLVARTTAGDAVWVDAMVDQVATLIAPDFPGAGRDELRSRAFGWLARPAELLRLLLEHQTRHQPTLPELEDPESDTSVPSSAVALPADLLDALRTVDPEKLRAPATVYVHLHQDVLGGRVAGVGRVEEAGPVLLVQLAELLGHARVTCTPVVDLNDRISVNSYEHPEPLKEQVHLTGIGDYFPHAVATHRRVDHDHVRPYDPGGPPGQTGSHNSGQLIRRHHRIKTHAPGWKVRQLGPGEYVWRTPHHRYRLVDHHRTHWLPPQVDSGLFSADPFDRMLSDAVIRLNAGHPSPRR